MSTAPITSSRFGSRDCPGCEKSLTDGREVTTIDGVDRVRNRYGGFSDGRTRPVAIRWHATCLAEFEATNAKYRAQVAADRISMAREIGLAAGWSEERIAAAIAKAGVA